MNSGRQPAKHRVIVVGAGIGGLVSALEGAARGLDVLVLERAETPGGKMRETAIAGTRLDAGPTVFTMRWVFEELFEAVGTRLDHHLSLHPVDVLARHAWDGSGPRGRLDLFSDIDRSADAIAAFSSAKEMRGYRDFCARARSTYQALEQPFLRSPRPNPVSLAGRAAGGGLGGLAGLMRISPFTTLWSELARHFADPRLRQLFGRYATYCGASPFLAPATLMLVAHVEQDGVWLVDGGMHRIAQTLARLAEGHGARFRYGAHVDEILLRGGRASGVRLAGGEAIEADAVVWNGDSAALGAGLLGAAVARAASAVPPAERSLSALTWNLVAPTRGFPLLRHTVFFSNDYAAEFKAIFERGELPATPTVYICAQDRGDSDASSQPTGPERMLCIVNAPARGDQTPFTPKELARCEAQTFDLLQRCGLQVERSPAHSVMTTPADFERLFPATGGALYGRASHGWKASFSRPGSRSRLPGLYLAGGSTHPGPGVPMAALSGRLAVASLLADQASGRGWSLRSTARSLPAATPGGTSTR